MFDCPMASYVWSLTAHVFGISCRPTTFEQFWEWVSRFIPTGRKFHMVGLVAICWALWRARNNIGFENKFVRSPTEVVCLVCSFLTYWAGLQKDDDRALLEAGIATLKATALEFHAQVYTQGGDFFFWRNKVEIWTAWSRTRDRRCGRLGSAALCRTVFWCFSCGVFLVFAPVLIS